MEVRFGSSYWFKFERRPFKKRFTCTDLYLYKTVARYLVAEGHFKYAEEKYKTRVWNSYTWFKNETGVICSRLFGERLGLVSAKDRSVAEIGGKSSILSLAR